MKGEGEPCEQGETAKQSGCIPEEGGGAKKETKDKNKQRASQFVDSLYVKETKDSKKLRKQIDKELSNIDVEKYQVRIQSVLEKGQVTIRVNSEILSKIIKEGRYKTIHEGVQSSGWKAPTKRIHLEEGMFGVPRDASPEERPVYGYVSTSSGREMTHPKEPKNNDYRNSHDPYASYGDVALVLKRDVSSRTSVTYGDSLNNRGMEIPSSMRNLHLGSTRYGWYHDPSNESVQKMTENIERMSQEIGAMSFETQVWGGVSVEDIDRVVFKSSPSSELISKLEEAGIEYEVLDNEENKSSRVKPSPFRKQND